MTPPHGPPPETLDVIETEAAPARPWRRTLIAVVLLGVAVAGYAITHGASPAGLAPSDPGTVALPGRPDGVIATRAEPSPDPELTALAQSAAEAATAAALAADRTTATNGRHIDGGGLGVRTSRGPALAGAEGATPGAYQVTLVCLGIGSVLVYVSDRADPTSGLAAAKLSCGKASGPAVTVQVTLRQPAFVLLAQPGSATVAGLGWSVRRS